MLNHTSEKFSSILYRLTNYRKKCFDDINNTLQSNDNILGILLGGSLSYKDNTEKSDIDLFCLIKNIEQFENELMNYKNQHHGISKIVYQGIFPWTNKLYTLYFENDFDFSIDISLINMETASSFFWEPDGIILFDNNRIIEKSRINQMKEFHYTKHPFLKTNPFTLSVVTIKKIEKNIARNHLWNALELLNILRRYVMQIIRLNVIKDDNFLGRVDRDIEDVLPTEYNNELIASIATYSVVDIVRKTLILIKILQRLEAVLKTTNENSLKKWLDEQLNYEYLKLEKYIDAQ